MIRCDWYEFRPDISPTGEVYGHGTTYRCIRVYGHDAPHIWEVPSKHLKAAQEFMLAPENREAVLQALWSERRPK